MSARALTRELSNWLALHVAWRVAHAEKVLANGELSGYTRKAARLAEQNDQAFKVLTLDDKIEAAKLLAAINGTRYPSRRALHRPTGSPASARRRSGRS